MLSYLFNLDEFSFVVIIDIVLVSVVVYYFYLAISKTRALPVFQGIVIIIVLSLITSSLKLTTISYILQYAIEMLFFAVVILFPAEIRRGLYRIGQNVFFSKRRKIKKKMLDIVLSTVEQLRETKTGAMIILELNDYLMNLVKSGVILNSEVETNLIISIFQKTSPLHDGSIVISNNKIKAAGCYINHLSNSQVLSSRYGTRHRAALGISEESDAVVLIISEETGSVSIAHKGNFLENLNGESLSSFLYDIFKKRGQNFKGLS